MTDIKHVDMLKLPTAVVRHARNSVSIVWVLPLIAALISGWLVYKSFSDRGPVIDVTFSKAGGIETGKTPVKYRDIKVGQVSEVDFSDDLSKVVVHIQMNAGTEDWLTADSRFWVVRPRIEKSGVSGLNTLLSGAYIEMEPGDRDAGRETRFSGLEEPPSITSDNRGTAYHLRAKQLNSISIGTPILYRHVAVGKVTNYRLAPDHSYVEVDIFIDAPHDQYVKTNSRFWNVSGLEMDLNSEGLKVGVESFVSLFTGGIAFETPFGRDNKRATENTLFSLYNSRDQTKEQEVTVSLPYVLYFHDTVRGLSVGAPVEYRGIRVGTVSQISLQSDLSNDEVRIPVIIEIEPERVGREHVAELDAIKAMLERLVKKGLRARLQSANLITGQLIVDLDLFPDLPPGEITTWQGLPVLPTTTGTLSDVTERLNRVLTQFEKLPIEAIGKNLEKTSVGANKLVNETGLHTSFAELSTSLEKFNRLVSSMDKEAVPLLKSTRQTVAQAKKTLSAYEGVVSERSPIGGQLLKTLEELSAAARSIRIMTEYLERHPEALLKGKSGAP